MTVTEAAEAWKTYKRKLKALGPEPKAAAEVLKVWFRAHPDKPVFKGVGYASSPTSGLDLDMVRAELDPKALRRCATTGTRETLSLLEPVAPKPKKPAAKKAAPAKKASA